MSSRRWRLSVYLFVSLLTVLLIIKSRTIPARKSAAFLHYTTGSLILKVTGSDGQDGIYRIIDGKNNTYVKNMTLGNVSYALKNDNSFNRELESGDVVEITGNCLRVTASRMTAVELILLGVPLNPAAMSADDWDSLPGIGTSLAGEIVRYCQNNGGIASVEELTALSGVGEGRIKRLRPFFR